MNDKHGKNQVNRVSRSALIRLTKKRVILGLFSYKLHEEFYSSDLNPLDPHLLGFLKDRVYENNPKTIRDLKNAIENKIQSNPI